MKKEWYALFLSSIKTEYSGLAIKKTVATNYLLLSLCFLMQLGGWVCWIKSFLRCPRKTSKVRTSWILVKIIDPPFLQFVDIFSLENTIGTIGPYFGH